MKALALLLGLSVAAAPAAAAPWEIVIDAGVAGQDSAENVPTGYDDEVDPALLIGLTGIRDLGRERAFEFSWLHAESQLDATVPTNQDLEIVTDTIDFAGTYRPDRQGARPFVSASAGLARLAPEGFDDEVTFGMALAGGSTFNLSPRVGLRLLARARFFFGDASFAGTCGPNACTLLLFADGGYRLEGTLGLVLRPGKPG